MSAVFYDSNINILVLKVNKSLSLLFKRTDTDLREYANKSNVRDTVVRLIMKLWTEWSIQEGAFRHKLTHSESGFQISKKALRYFEWNTVKFNYKLMFIKILTLRQLIVVIKDNLNCNVEAYSQNLDGLTFICRFRLYV